MTSPIEKKNQIKITYKRADGSTEDATVKLADLRTGEGKQQIEDLLSNSAEEENTEREN